MKAIRYGLLLALLVSLTACSAGNKQGVPTNSNESTSTAFDKPTLVVPETFANDTARQMFVTRAVYDGYYTEAKKLLEQKGDFNQDPASLALLGTVRYNLQDLDGAIEAWKQAAVLDPSHAGAMQNNIGNALRDKNLITEAKAAYRKALELEPTLWNAAINLADVLKSEGMVEEGVSVLENSLAHNAGVEPLASFLASYKEQL